MVDASEGQVFLVVHHGDTSHLYISDIEGYRYSLSLQNVVYYSPTVANADYWLRSVT